MPVAAGARRKAAQKKSSNSVLSFPKTWNEAVNEYFADLTGLVIVAIFCGWQLSWSGSAFFERFILLSGNVTDGTEDGVDFLYQPVILGDIQFIVFWGMLWLAAVDIMRDLFYLRITKSFTVVKDLQPKFAVELNYLVAQAALTYGALKALSTTPGMTFTLEHDTFTMKVFMLLEASFWAQAPISAYFIYKLRKADYKSWCTRCAAYLVGIMVLYFLSCHKLAVLGLLCDHVREVCKCAAVLLQLAAKQKSDTDIKKALKRSNGDFLTQLNHFGQPIVHLFVFFISIVVPYNAVSNSVSATDMTKWCVTSVVLVGYQLIGYSI